MVLDSDLTLMRLASGKVNVATSLVPDNAAALNVWRPLPTLQEQVRHSLASAAIDVRQLLTTDLSFNFWQLGRERATRCPKPT